MMVGYCGRLCACSCCWPCFRQQNGGNAVRPSCDVKKMRQPTEMSAVSSDGQVLISFSLSAFSDYQC